MRSFLEKFFTSYLKERNFDATLDCVTDNIISIGTGEQEVAKSKAELGELLKEEFEQMPEPLWYEVSNYEEISLGSGDVKSAFANVYVKLVDDGDIIDLYTRLLCTCCKVDGDWKLAAVHMSTPTATQEQCEFFPLRYSRMTKNKMSHKANEKLMELISKSLPGGIMGGYLEEGFPLYTINDKMLEILGYTYDELIDATDEKMTNIIYEGDRNRVEESINAQFELCNEYEVEYRVIGKGGRIIWVNDIGKKIVTDDGREAMISIMTDITERVEREGILIKEANADALTGLYNRRKVISVIEEALGLEQSGSLFICDVDNFKSLNDTKGHIEGDKVLVKLAEYMRKYIKHRGIAARLGGDEFLLFFPNTEGDNQDMIDIVKSIQTDFVSYVKQNYSDLDVSLSAGGVKANQGDNFQTLYRRADDALYIAKKTKGYIEFSGKI